jgi:hypothetical protein
MAIKKSELYSSLFRGNAEADIRSSRVRKGYIKGRKLAVVRMK